MPPNRVVRSQPPDAHSVRHRRATTAPRRLRRRLRADLDRHSAALRAGDSIRWAQAVSRSVPATLQTGVCAGQHWDRTGSSSPAKPWSGLSCAEPGRPTQRGAGIDATPVGARDERRLAATPIQPCPRSAAAAAGARLQQPDPTRRSRADPRSTGHRMPAHRGRALRVRDRPATADTHVVGSGRRHARPSLVIHRTPPQCGRPAGPTVVRAWSAPAETAVRLAALGSPTRRAAWRCWMPHCATQAARLGRARCRDGRESTARRWHRRRSVVDLIVTGRPAGGITSRSRGCAGSAMTRASLPPDAAVLGALPEHGAVVPPGPGLAGAQARAGVRRCRASTPGASAAPQDRATSSMRLTARGLDECSRVTAPMLVGAAGPNWSTSRTSCATRPCGLSSGAVAADLDASRVASVVAQIAPETRGNIRATTRRNSCRWRGPYGATADAGVRRWRRPWRPARRCRCASSDVPASTITRTSDSVPGRTQQHPAGVAQFGLGAVDRGAAPRATTATAALSPTRTLISTCGNLVTTLGQLGQRACRISATVGHQVQRGQQAVTGGGVVGEDQVPGLLAAERVAAGPHVLQHVPVADGRWSAP